MNTLQHRPGRRFAITMSASLALLLGLAACASDRTETTERPAGLPAPPLSAEAKFFAGRIETLLSLSRTGFAGRRPPREPGRSRHGGGGSRVSVGVGGRMEGDGGPNHGGNYSSSEHPVGGRGGERRNDDGPPAPRIRESDLPPVSFHLRFVNHGETPAVVEVLDFNSALGNFVVRPEKITVPPGDSADAEPMTSRLGDADGELPVTIRLRLDGRVEKQVVTLHPVPAGPPPAEKP
jgi:hypothetical protein